MTQKQKYEAFRVLHEKTFIIPNPWNAGTARILTHMGATALATTSAGLAASLGLNDATASLNRNTVLENARQIVDATHLPVAADLEDCFGIAPETCAETIQMACDCGLVGGSIEDATGNPDKPIYDFNHAVDRVTAAVEAAHDLPFLLTARAENFLHGQHDLDDTIKRLQAFERAGADVLFAPGLPDLESIQTVCQSVEKPVNVVIGLMKPAVDFKTLEKAGVKRISVGGSLARAALGAFERASRELLESGTFEYAKTAMTSGDLANWMTSKPLEVRI